MKIRKIIREEIEDDFGWAKDIPPLAGGGLFPENEICFDEGDDCMVNINKDSIIFRVPINEDFLYDYSHDDTWLLETLFRTSIDGGGYDGDGDYYEFDSEEFNYVGHYLNDELRKRIVDFWLEVNEGEELKEDLEGLFGDYMLSFRDYLKSPTLDNMFDNLIDNVLNELGYTVQRNRWISTSNQFYNEIEKIRASGIGVKMDRDYGLFDLVITVPMEMVNKISRQYSFKDLQSLFERIMKPIFSGYWYDNFYDGWDSWGAEDEIVGLWERFLDDGEEFINSDKYKEEKKRIDFVYGKIYSEGWEPKMNDYYYVKMFEKPCEENPGSTWILRINNLNGFIYRPEEAVLSGMLRNNTRQRWDDRVSFEVGRKENESMEAYLDRFLNEVENASQEYAEKYFK